MIGIVSVSASLFLPDVVLRCCVTVFGMTCLWSIHELFKQEKRVQKGWFPDGRKRPDKHQKLYEQYHEQGFEILDFPCNQFAFQASGSDDKIDSFCKLRYDTKFPRFAKIKVNGKDAAPLYVYLKEKFPGRIGWNFAKFLVDRSGNVVGRFAPTEKPETLMSAIEQELEKR